ncbi:MAG: hypothetical protein H8D46_03320 [FCB group bacterium]|nr:hypothetical protein [FCB group bacterium]
MNCNIAGVNRVRFLRIAWVLMAIGSWIYAAEFVSQGGELFENASDGRTAAMAYSSVSSAAGPASIFSNPALALNDGRSILLFTHVDQFAGVVNRDMFAYRIGKLRNGIVTVGLVNRSIDDIPDTRNAMISLDADGPHLDYDAISHFSQNEIGFVLSYAALFRDKHAIGINAKPVFTSLGDYSAWGLGFDLGYFLQIRGNLSAGVFLQDITTTFIKWNTGTTELIPPRVVVGGSYTRDHLLLSCDLSGRLGEENPDQGITIGGQTLHYNLGTAWKIVEDFQILAGTSSLHGYTFGFSLTRDFFSFNYAFLSPPIQSVLKNSHQFGIALDLNKLRQIQKWIEP